MKSGQVIKQVFWLTKCSLSVLNIDSKNFVRLLKKSLIRSRTAAHLCGISARNMTRVVMNFDYWPLVCSLSVLNKGSKHDSRQVK
jgi:hypothetical protein